MDKFKFEGGEVVFYNVRDFFVRRGIIQEDRGGLFVIVLLDGESHPSIIRRGNVLFV